MTAPPADQIAERLALAERMRPIVFARREEKRAERAAQAEARAARLRARRSAAAVRGRGAALLAADDLSPVAAVRLRRSVDQATFAAKLGVSRATLAKIERDPREVSGPTRWKVAEALGTTPRKLWPELYA